MLQKNLCNLSNMAPGSWNISVSGYSKDLGMFFKGEIGVIEGIGWMFHLSGLKGKEGNC